ncbi:hypothetical protein UFOVP961_49 [uncultured Caudovirales phage]|jgi:hypothetical protein|uniref:Uncharacterized protein n=1 Tax=uncultured Caudovirales phage TaxID=2100421 RepID=A0A6J5R884_9CAUD|nr:hypothetical protein UFOVP961_49 [uncultured Caudovirales phage]CAB4185670.1 hypothetical protein UFOVP1123_119 [uncultured Caudovirales phage]CAB4193149.1 hypothetical protein UFOVP1239_31 [uncultured Caudovirales phage]CAB4216204.1 hypothetical protein UFOVP1484_123 [uncultured Caudovirales phage]CAB5230830.1 hypothetical protein UFOVP1577_129 [uncultured Caudovirales phage]
MKTLTFTYTKADGSESERVLQVLVSPNTMYEGIDISELDLWEQTQFMEAMQKAEDNYKTALFNIYDEFDVKKNYRRFDPRKITELVEETL